MEFNKFPMDGATDAVESLAKLKWLCEFGDPVGRELADCALDHATFLLVTRGLLDMLITRAANNQAGIR